ncbi:gamma-mobile-trio protein GmtX [Bradyrhizobium sp.]|uniref:gamma-mobile-trio protein GmtX n=1 Tax=Bradyrhizobium sp. TaxID=376 RepID=UPI00271FF472|nr:gamma-mobile-trio protein GmtX [Bradyrhizobium sp.]MDO9294351.1 gamma-mobile-trio protein GmtX [Bradyrhizobium sp.]
MTKIAIENLLNETSEHLETVLARASSEKVRYKLRKFDEACRHIVCKAQLRLTIPQVMKTYAAIADSEIGESTIRNKRGGENLYQLLYRKWETVAVAMVASSVPRKRGTDVGVIGDHDILLIENPVVRHQVVLLMAQNRSLYRQLNIVKQDQTNIPIRIEGVSLAPADDLALSDAEVESIRDFIDPRKMKAKHLQATSHKGVKLKDGRPIADPGFLDALGKIVRSYEPR